MATRTSSPATASVGGPRKIGELLAGRQKRESSMPLYGRPRATALAEWLTQVDFREHLKKIRADSAEYTRKGLKDLMATVRPERIDREGIEKFVQAQAKASSSRSSLFSAEALTLRSASSGDPEPRERLLQPGSFYQYDHIHVDGEGDGLDYQTLFSTLFIAPFLLPIASLGGSGTWAYAQPSWEFSFTPTDPGDYAFSATLIASGTYALAADDGWPDSKEAACKITASLYAPSNLATVNTRNRVMFDRRDDNILEAESFFFIDKVSSVGYCEAGVEVKPQAAIFAEIMARGDGSHADLDCSGNVGFFACMGLNVTQLP